MKKFLTLLGCVVGSLAAGAIGSLATTPNIPTWYAGLVKPFLNPPNFIFGPTWTVLYVLMGVALYLVVRSNVTASKRDAYAAFTAQLILNTLWSIAFFGLQSPLAGVAIIVLLVAAIILTMIKFKPFSNAAVWLLVPYLLWVLFATYLTIAIAVLN